MLIKWSIFFTLFALPLIFLPPLYLSFELPKVLLFYLLSTLTLVGLLYSNPKIHKINTIHLLGVLFLVWLFLSSVVGANFEHSLFGSYFRRQGLITWFGYFLLFISAGVAIKNQEWRLKISWAITISSTMVAILGIIQFLMLWVLGNSAQLLYNGRIISTFGQPNFLGAYLVASIPFVWYLFSCTKKRSAKSLLLTSLIILVLAIIFTFSRSSWLALAIISLIWAFSHYKMFLTALTGLIIIFAILGNLFPILVSREWSRFQVDLNKQWSAENRTQIAEKSVELISKRPITGWGAENLLLTFPMVVQADDVGLRDIVVDSAHNLFLDLSVESGLIGGALFLLFILAIFLTTLKGLKSKDSEEKIFQKVLLLCILAFLISHQFSVISVVPMTLFFISAGILAGPLFNLQNEEHSQLKLFITIVASLITLWFIHQNLRAEIHYKKASSLEVTNTREALKLELISAETTPWVQFYNWRATYLKKQLGE